MEHIGLDCGDINASVLLAVSVGRPHRLDAKRDLVDNLQAVDQRADTAVCADSADIPHTRCEAVLLDSASEQCGTRLRNVP